MRRTPGTHVPNIKNRSSKHLGWFTKIKPLVRCMSGEALASSGDPMAIAEINRRAKKRMKKEKKG